MTRDIKSPPSLTARQHLEKAVWLDRQGRLPEAEHHYRDVLRLDRGHKESLRGLAAVLARMGRAAEAAEVYERIVATAEKDGAARTQLGLLLCSLGREADALPHLERALALDPKSSDAHLHVANAQAALNRGPDALAHYAKAVVLNPRSAEAHARMADVLADLGRHDEAVLHFEKSLAIRPNVATAVNGLGRSLGALGRREEAVTCFQRALSLLPRYPAAQNNLGAALAALGRHDRAVLHFRSALAEQPNNAAALDSLGKSLCTLGRADEALDAFRKLIALEPDNAEAHFGAATAALSLGRHEAARAEFERSVALAPSVPRYHRALVMAKTIRGDDPQIEEMERLAARADMLPPNERVALHFARAKALEDLGHHAAVFDALRNGNFLKRGGLVYDERAQLAAMRDMERVFTRELFETHRGSGDSSQLPVFVVGMPRAGLALVEQILASHPRAFGAGTTPHLAGMIAAGEAGTRFPFNISSLSADRLKRFGTDYAAKLRNAAPAAERIVESSHANVTLLGLIHLVLPKARIVHVRRDPLDLCFSCFATLFPRDMAFAYDLAELGRYHRSYTSLMAHWRQVLPQGAIYEMGYEHLVQDAETQTRRLVEYCALPWDDRCLRFWETERPVPPEHARLRRPLDAASLGRARPYAEWLGALRAALEDELEPAR